MSQDELKKAAAREALAYIEPGMVLGVGSGTTVHFFIEALGTVKHRIEGAVASSEETAHRLVQQGIQVLDLNSTGPLPLYIDGADEATRHLQLVKGGGGALTREKIIASASDRFICLIDESKLVDVLGCFPVALEVIPMARSTVARQVVKLGGDPVYRKSFVTDNGNQILDVHNLEILEPSTMERNLQQIPGVVECGIFAVRRADLLLVARESGCERLTLDA